MQSWYIPSSSSSFSQNSWKSCLVVSSDSRISTFPWDHKKTLLLNASFGAEFQGFLHFLYIGIWGPIVLPCAKGRHCGISSSCPVWGSGVWLSFMECFAKDLSFSLPLFPPPHSLCEWSVLARRSGWGVNWMLFSHSIAYSLPPEFFHWLFLLNNASKS